MIRKAIKSYSYNIAKLIVSGWQTAYKGLIDDKFLSNMSVDIMSEGWKSNISSQNQDNNIYVYEENHQILGIIRFGKPADTSSNYNAEIHVLYVEPSLKRNGIGTTLFNFATEHFINNKTTNMIIWCLKGNAPSIKFYEKMGGKIVTTRKTVINNIELEEVGLEYNLLSSSITLRKYKETDADEIIKWLKDERALKLWSADRYKNHPITSGDINNNYNECKNLGNFYPMTLVHGDKIVGLIILRNPDSANTKIIRLGFIIVDPTLRGKGYGKMLIQKAIKYAKKGLSATEITLGVFDNNESAYHCYKSVGFKEVSIEEDAFKFQNESWNCIEMKLD